MTKSPDSTQRNAGLFLPVAIVAPPGQTIEGSNMLIRLANEDLVEYPDEVGALALADPSGGDVPEYSLDELNLTINGLLAMFYDEALTLEENIEWARGHYTKWGTPTAINLEKAHELIRLYKQNVAPADIGYGPLALVKALYGIQSSKPDDNIIDQAPNHVKSLTAPDDAQGQHSNKATPIK